LYAVVVAVSHSVWVSVSVSVCHAVSVAVAVSYAVVQAVTVGHVEVELVQPPPHAELSPRLATPAEAETASARRTVAYFIVRVGVLGCGDVGAWRITWSKR